MECVKDFYNLYANKGCESPSALAVKDLENIFGERKLFLAVLS